MMPGIPFRRFSIMFGVVALAVCVVGLASLSFSRRVVNAQTDEFNAPVVGVWEVFVEGAPFGPHLFTFHSDHTFLSSNPDAGDPNTSDSDGEGVWQGWNTVQGTFKEYDADRTTHEFTGTLTVTYTIKLKGNKFTGTYTATETNPAGDVEGSGTGTFTGYRLGTAPKGFNGSAGTST
jgi:hypothetical protein